MLFGINTLYIWLAVIVLCVVIEALTLDLCAIWFAVGGVAALVAASLSLEVVTQLIIFVLFSAVLLVLMRPFCRRFLKTKKEPTNADRIIGETAYVTEQIDNIRETGAVKVLGAEWSARSRDDSIIPSGAKVKVVEIRGVKAVVEKVG
ncbi:NfeD family protein [Agathobaculum sp.]|uniref:NfeD family protein n=1 Tax=Agathobaculum sp. TaxID=2048138 RepID=UPI0025D3AF1E|nr:NfeD family protein [Agathobaculum sp.]MBS6640281.1 NfeD family protein [Clostridiaceae bacterium]